MSVERHKETLGFQTEVRQLLDLMIHSLYSNKEIFLRELISNASDAADKLRFEALSDDSLFEGEGDLRIHVRCDGKARTITVSDNGIGMSRQEVVENLGTIAHSGTRQFFQALTGDRAKDAQLIGEFGVGFYSSFVVADRVTVITRRAGLAPEEGVRWDSSGEGEFTVETVSKDGRGTDVVLHLRPDEDDLLDEHRLREIIRRYSDHISLPILMPKADKPEEDETVNRATALWTRGRNEIEASEYEEFYKHIAHDFEAPLAHVHLKVEGKLEYSALLFIPARAPFDLWDRASRRGIKLYVRRVFIMDDAEQLMPPYLRFVRGVVDSADLPLNISREILQQNRQIDSMRGGCVKKILGLLETMAANEPDKYARFWGEFGRVLKEGVVEDAASRDAIAKLLRFASTRSDSEEQNVSLDEYIERMGEGQDRIYYVTADSFAAAKNSPHLEIFRKKGIEVLLLPDDVDEWVVMHLTSYRDKALQSVSRGDLALDEPRGGQEKETPASGREELQELTRRIRETLGERVKDVRLSSRLTDSPACLVTDEQDMGKHLERLLRAAGQKVPGSTPILEINPDHPVVRRIAGEEAGGRFDDWARVLLDQALLSEGGTLEDPAGFVKRLNRMLVPAGDAPEGAAGS